MKWTLVVMLFVVCSQLDAQIINSVYEVIKDLDKKHWYVMGASSSNYKIGSYEFSIEEDNLEVVGVQSQLELYNFGMGRLRKSEFLAMQESITEVLKKYDAKLIYRTDDLLISTYSIDQLGYEPTYLELQIVKRKINFRAVITLMEDPDRYYENKEAMIEPVVSSAFLTNPSFEDTPNQGRNIEYYANSCSNPDLDDLSIDGWYDCGTELFPGASAPDIHSRESNFWGCSFPPSNGETYLGLVTRSSETWESVSQELSTDLEQGICYDFSIDVRLDKNYSSPIIEDETQITSFSTPIILRVYLGDKLCSYENLFFQTQPISNEYWSTVSLNFECDANYDHITMEVYYDQTKSPYNGSMMLDRAKLEKSQDCK